MGWGGGVGGSCGRGKTHFGGGWGGMEWVDGSGGLLISFFYISYNFIFYMISYVFIKYDVIHRVTNEKRKTGHRKRFNAPRHKNSAREGGSGALYEVISGVGRNQQQHFCHCLYPPTPPGSTGW